MLTKRAVRQLWAVDRVLIAYYGAMGVAIACLWSRLPAAPWLLAWHAVAILLIVFASRHDSRASFVFRHWYPLPYVAWCFREMTMLIPALRIADRDAELARIDYRFWGVNPTVWLERFTTPILTEYLQVVYTLFVPAVLLIAALLWRQRRYAEFRYYAFLIALGYLVSYIGYVLVPARGPRYFLTHLQTVELRGLWFTQLFQATLDQLETKAWDCFPSGHTELTILAWWSSRLISTRLFWLYFAYTLSIISATVYLRYHYTIDILAGALVAGLLTLWAPRWYQILQKEAV
jgi:membrane-associated phospholipid phosphatase